MSELDDFLWTCVVEIERRAAVAAERREVLTEGAAVFRSAMESTRPIDAELTTVAALAHLPINSPARQVPWIATPRLAGNDGSAVVLGLVDQVRDLGDVTCGLMLLAPGAAYPEHGHPPQEIYLPLSGDGQWRFGGADEYRQLGPDELVYNPPGVRHGAVAADDPLLAIYVLWS